MSTKEIAMETIKGLSENASWQEIEARIHLLAEVNLGYEQLQRGEGTTITTETEFLNLARGK
jgi:excinuclease UvrABC ATPase subunit